MKSVEFSVRNILTGNSGGSHHDDDDSDIGNELDSDDVALVAAARQPAVAAPPTTPTAAAAGDRDESTDVGRQRNYHDVAEVADNDDAAAAQVPRTSDVVVAFDDRFHGNDDNDASSPKSDVTEEHQSTPGAGFVGFAVTSSGADSKTTATSVPSLQSAVDPRAHHELVWSSILGGPNAAMAAAAAAMYLDLLNPRTQLIWKQIQQQQQLLLRQQIASSVDFASSAAASAELKRGELMHSNSCQFS